MFIVQKINHEYKMGKIRQTNIENWTNYFYNDIFNRKNLSQTCQKFTKNHTKTVFTTLHISELKKLMIVKIFTVWILCIWVLIMKVDTLRKKMEINT